MNLAWELVQASLWGISVNGTSITMPPGPGPQPVRYDFCIQEVTFLLEAKDGMAASSVPYSTELLTITIPFWFHLVVICLAQHPMISQENLSTPLLTLSLSSSSSDPRTHLKHFCDTAIPVACMVPGDDGCDPALFPFSTALLVCQEQSQSSGPCTASADWFKYYICHQATFRKEMSASSATLESKRT